MATISQRQHSKEDALPSLRQLSFEAELGARMGNLDNLSLIPPSPRHDSGAMLISPGPEYTWQQQANELLRSPESPLGRGNCPPPWAQGPASGQATQQHTQHQQPHSQSDTGHPMQHCVQDQRLRHSFPGHLPLHHMNQQQQLLESRTEPHPFEGDRASAQPLHAWGLVQTQAGEVMVGEDEEFITISGAPVGRGRSRPGPLPAHRMHADHRPDAPMSTCMSMPVGTAGIATSALPPVIERSVGSSPPQSNPGRQIDMSAIQTHHKALMMDHTPVQGTPRLEQMGMARDACNQPQSLEQAQQDAASAFAELLQLTSPVAAPWRSTDPPSFQALLANSEPGVSNTAKRPRPARACRSFEAYEARYKQPAARCAGGTCREICGTPCEIHLCKCCKKHRQLLVEGVPREKRYCGMCIHREKVEGLQFVRCDHVKIVDGEEVRCGVEMLRDVLESHWKQHRSGMVPESQNVETDEGRRCGTCTNMRPITYFSKQDTNCSCNHCQSLKTRVGQKTGTLAACTTKDVRTAFPSSLPSSSINATSERMVAHRHANSFGISGSPARSPLATSADSALQPTTPSTAIADGGGGSHTVAIRMGCNKGQGLDCPLSGRGNNPANYLPQPATNEGFQTAAPRSAANTPESHDSARSMPHEFSWSAPHPERSADNVMEAWALQSSLLGNAVCRCPTFRLLLGKWHESRAQSSPDETAVKCVLSNLVKAVREADRMVAGINQMDWEHLLAQGNSLMGGMP